jgi:hypothetical protein
MDQGHQVPQPQGQPIKAVVAAAVITTLLGVLPLLRVVVVL